MQALGTWKGGYQTVLEDGRTHTVTVDLPRDEGGASAGTTALELLVLSLAGCITTIFALVARRRRLEFQGMSIALQAERPKGSRTITRVHGTLRVRTKAELAEVQTVLRMTLQSCPVGVLFEQAHVPVEVVAIAEPTIVSAPSRGAEPPG
ncbi:MAG TPA: OsmC family protein [Thermoplasmata archaeon]|nr:OsmC family protein [Thermoplasmata archaeon]